MCLKDSVTLSRHLLTLWVKRNVPQFWNVPERKASCLETTREGSVCIWDGHGPT